MGTRADFYVGRGADAEWMGSIGYGGYPKGISKELLEQTTLDGFLKELARFFAPRDDVSIPAMGWPWPWDDSYTTDCSYAFDNGKVWASNWGYDWFDPLLPQSDDDEGEKPRTAVFPNMTSKRNMAAAGTQRSGLMVVSLPERSV